MAQSSEKANAFEAEVRLLREENTSLKHQLDWFKRQLFGEKSEKRLHIDNSHQPSLLDELIPRNWKDKFSSNPLRSDLYLIKNRV